ncbi:uncharacterized protein LOC125478548 [Pyrus x bretschneideri]|uniref:uncharacterized protein LOC125478548 n=1 Tax=Pyrus x bretschneideri TaxID=225117 RepID=UPI00202F9592|nr:uncharacterized protein LOC125478548 [Pyrus x bretschneideri]
MSSSSRMLWEINLQEEKLFNQSEGMLNLQVAQNEMEEDEERRRKDDESESTYGKVLEPSLIFFRFFSLSPAPYFSLLFSMFDLRVSLLNSLRFSSVAFSFLFLSVSVLFSLRQSFVFPCFSLCVDRVSYEEFLFRVIALFQWLKKSRRNVLFIPPEKIKKVGGHKSTDSTLYQHWSMPYKFTQLCRGLRSGTWISKITVNRVIGVFPHFLPF